MDPVVIELARELGASRTGLDSLRNGLEAAEDDEAALWALVGAMNEDALLAYVDWKEEASEALGLLGNVACRTGAPWPNDPTLASIAGEAANALERGSAPAPEVAERLDEVLAPRGWRLLQLDADWDAYAYFVVPARTHERWRHVRLLDGLALGAEPREGAAPPPGGFRPAPVPLPAGEKPANGSSPWWRRLFGR